MELSEIVPFLMWSHLTARGSHAGGTRTQTLGVDSLQPGGWQAPKEAIQCLGVDVAEEAGEVWDGGIMTKLVLRKVVKELLSDPVEDPEGHVVGTTAQVPVVDPETQLEM
jgi:hypothetical protein